MFYRHTNFLLLVLTLLLIPGTLSAQNRASHIAPTDNPRIAAELQFDHGKLIFIDETIDGTFGFGILEQGGINLAPFYEAGASALEIFLALAPADAEVPEILFRAHELARQRNPILPAAPRTTLIGGMATKALIGYAFSQDTDNCWGWGGVAVYDPVVGDDSHSTAVAQGKFLDWSGVQSAGTGSFFAAAEDQDASSSDMFYTIPFGNERAFSICVTHANLFIPEPDDGPWYCTETASTFFNTVNLRLTLWGFRKNGDSWSSDALFLTAYGKGARYRSSSNELRKYQLRVADISIESGICQEKFEVFTQGFEDDEIDDIEF